MDTVESNNSKYSNDDYSSAVTARMNQALIGRPSLCDYIEIIKKGHLPNCPINPEDILAAEDIFGPEAGGMNER
jgi:hypothetical protein